MKPVDINPADLETVRRVLREHVPGLEVWAFGSRVSWTARETSDLDIALVTVEPLDVMRLAEIREAFTKSDLPFGVDIVDWASVSERFQKIIRREYTIVRTASKKQDGDLEDSISADRSWLYHTRFPDHWDRRFLYSLAQWVNGLAFRNIQFSSTGKPVIKIAEIKGGISGQTKFTHQTFDESVHIRFGDLLFSWSGQPETSINAFWWRGSEGWLNQHVFRVTPISGIDTKFFYYLLRYLKPNFVGIARNKQTTGLGHVTKRDLENIEVALPPLSEQRAVAHVLGMLDNKIELNQQMNRTLEEMAQALFKSWFVDFDPVRAKMDGCWYPGKSLPGLPAHLYNFFPETLVDSELGEIPEGWKVKALDDIARYRNGLALQKFRPQENDGRLPVVKIAQLRIDRTGNKEWATENITPECIIDDGDVVFSWSGSLMVKVWCGGKAALNQHLFKVTSIEYPKWFYLHCTKIHLPEFQRIAVDKTTTMGHIKHQHLRDAKCIVPNHDTLVAVDNIFSTMLLQQISIKIQSRFLTTQRDTLLPKLMSGELRISQPACKGGILK